MNQFVGSALEPRKISDGLEYVRDYSMYHEVFASGFYATQLRNPANDGSSFKEDQHEELKKDAKQLTGPVLIVPGPRGQAIPAGGVSRLWDSTLQMLMWVGIAINLFMLWLRSDKLSRRWQSTTTHFLYLMSNFRTNSLGRSTSFRIERAIAELHAAILGDDAEGMIYGIRVLSKGLDEKSKRMLEFYYALRLSVEEIAIIFDASCEDVRFVLAKAPCSIVDLFDRNSAISLPNNWKKEK